MASILKKIGVDTKYLEARKKAKEQKKADKKLEKERKKASPGGASEANGAAIAKDEEIYDFEDVDSSSGEEELPSARSSVVSVSVARGKPTIKQQHETIHELEKHVSVLSSEKIQLIADYEEKEREWKKMAEGQRVLREEERKVEQERRQQEMEVAREVAEKAKREEEERLQKLKGFLSKKGHVRHNWKQRWFQLDYEDGFLVYHEDERCVKLRGKVNLRGGATLQDAEHHDRPYCFIIKEAGGKPFFLSSGSFDDTLLWKRALENALRKFHNAETVSEAPAAPETDR